MSDTTRTPDVTPTLDELIDATGGNLARDGESVVVGYGNLGYLRLHPDYVISRGERSPAARIEGRLSAANGAKYAELRQKLADAGIRVR